VDSDATFPKPAAVLETGNVWTRAAVLEWALQHPEHVGEPTSFEQTQITRLLLPEVNEVIASRTKTPRAGITDGSGATTSNWLCSIRGAQGYQEKSCRTSFLDRQSGATHAGGCPGVGAVLSTAPVSKSSSVVEV
jgi:hypothetical protein